MLVCQGVRHLPGNDSLRQPFDDGGLADTGLPDEHRVVLRPPRKDLHDPLNLVTPADHRVQLAIARQLSEVPAELIEPQWSRRWTSRWSAAAASPGVRARGRLLALYSGEQLDHGLADFVELRSELLQHLSRDAFTLANEPEEDVLSADVVVTKLQCLAERQLENLLCPRGERDVAARRLRPLPDDLDNLLTDRLEVDAEALETTSSDALALVDQPEEDVLGADVVVVEETSFFLSKDHDSSCPVREPLKHVFSPQKNLWRSIHSGASLSIAKGLV